MRSFKIYIKRITHTPVLNITTLSVTTRIGRKIATKEMTTPKRLLCFLASKKACIPTTMPMNGKIIAGIRHKIANTTSIIAINKTKIGAANSKPNARNGNVEPCPVFFIFPISFFQIHFHEFHTPILSFYLYLK